MTLKSREQGASANTELWDWNGWEPTELEEDREPLAQRGKTDLTQNEHGSKSRKKSGLLRNRIRQNSLQISPAGSATAHLN